MKKNILLAATAALFSYNTYAQKSDYFYARVQLEHANKVEELLPNDIEIIDNNSKEAVVYMSRTAAEKLHRDIMHASGQGHVHGPGYYYYDTKKDALDVLHNKIQALNFAPTSFTITEDATVKAALSKLKEENLVAHINELVAYKTRRHNTEESRKSAIDLKARWEKMAASYNRNDISVRLFEHDYKDLETKMPSVIMTIKGTDEPSQIVIVGGHLDSANMAGDGGGVKDSPGADDNASGIATITEAFRALLEIGFKPKKTIEVMAYAAEEEGLRGSLQVAKKYKDERKNVVAVGQFDMTNYKGSEHDINFITTNTDSGFNGYLKKLLDHYHGESSNDKITYGESKLTGGASSDHESWHKQGYIAAFPFEASMDPVWEYNTNIHTSKDKISVSKGKADHALRFTKLCVEIMIEVAKGKATLSTGNFTLDGYTVNAVNGGLHYRVDASKSPITKLAVYNIQGKLVKTAPVAKKEGTLALKNLSAGVYIATVSLENGKSFNKKFVLK